MLIVNPIYDSAFSYLMEDLDCAREIISALLDKEITYIALKRTKQTFVLYQKYRIVHADFIATIKESDGTYRNILIEMQKSNLPTVLLRFRRYLGNKYHQQDQIINSEGETETTALPITTIYFLGFMLPEKELPSVLEVNRVYKDRFTKKVIQTKSNFVENLSHDSYIIQIPKLHLTLKDKLEKILSIFDQHIISETDSKYLDYKTKDMDKDVKRLVDRMHQATQKKSVITKMEGEEMYTRYYDNLLEQNSKYMEEVKIAKEEIQKKKEEIQKKDEQLETERKNAETERAKMIQTINNMKAKGMDDQTISEITGMSISEIKKI